MYFRELIEQEKEQTKDIGSFNSMHEIYGVLMKEVSEFFDEVRLKPELRSPENILKELVQIAAVVERAAEDMRLVEQTSANSSTNEYKNKYDELSLALNEFLDKAIITPGNKLQPNKENNFSFKTLLVPEEIYNKLLECSPPTSL